MQLLLIDTSYCRIADQRQQSSNAVRSEMEQVVFNDVNDVNSVKA